MPKAQSPRPKAQSPKSRAAQGPKSKAQTSTTVNVRLTTSGGPSGCGVTVAWETRAGTASAGADFVAGAGTVVFPAGSANGATQQIPITLLPDDWDEDDETLVVALANPVGALLGADSSATITIVDDDPTPALSITSVSVPEPDSGSTSATLTVTLSNPSGREVTASFATADGTATAGADYLAESGTITFEPGTTSQQISVSVLGDLESEADETFTVTLSSVQHADPPAGPATVTIVDNDRMEVTLVANRSFPMAAGQSVTFTATASKGTPPYEYLFRLTQHSTGTTRRVQGYFQTQTFTWTPATPGTYTLTVWARTVGNTVDYEAARSIAVTITEAPPISVTSLTPNNPGPVEGGTTVVWTAVASGGVPPLQYQFIAHNTTTGASEVVRDYAPSPTLSWAPLRAGTYTIEVRVRSAGSSAPYDATRQYTGYSVYMGGLSPVSLTADQVFPIAPGTPVTWTFQCASGTPPPYFQFLFRPTSTSTWTIGQAYSTSNTWTWTPTTPDTYAIQVWGKESYFPGQYQTLKNGPTVTVAPGPVSSVGLTASQPVPLTAGQTITWTASATGGNAPLEYRYWLYDSNAGTWTVVRDYSPERSWTWTPATYGQYALQVWVRPQGSTADYESYAAFGFFTVTP
ncbi:MAG TPA: Calx-beta domain-containing protein [Vicinamibacterales bacterium]